jgi:hypothetical protein
VTPQAQIIAIAEACGWTNISWYGVYQDWLGSRPNECRDTYPIPDYLNDLNAMHEAETLVIYSNDKSPKKYTQQIKAAICKDAGVKKAQMDFDMCITATAAQRAEAFLKTIGKWKEPCNL